MAGTKKEKAKMNLHRFVRLLCRLREPKGNPVKSGYKAQPANLRLPKKIPPPPPRPTNRIIVEVRFQGSRDQGAEI